jgi:thiol-disulfide isomerase/thioredoxin
MKFFKRLFIIALGLIANTAIAKDVSMPDIQGISHWLNTDKPLTREDLRGKVVLVDFWTYSCINCILTFPHINSWHEKYADKGLLIIGVHTPEFDFEKEANNVKAAVAKYGIRYPVAMDNDYKTWRAYSNRYWPAHYLADRKGFVRYTHFGEGNYEETERRIVELLAQGGSPPSPSGAKSATTEAEDSGTRTPEIYLGYLRLAVIGNPEKIMPDRRQTFRGPMEIADDKFYLSGGWRIAREYAALETAPGKILIRYEAGKANMVLDTDAGQEVAAEVYVDGRPATLDNKGSDVVLEKGKAVCRIREPRLYNLTKTKDSGRHTLELRFMSPGIRAYTFTFG